MGRVFGIPLLLHWSWIIVMPVYAGSIAMAFLPELAPGLSYFEYWTLGLITTLLLVASVIGHELAHALVARGHGLRIHDITLYIFGGIARMTGDPPTPRAEFQIAIVGPGASFAIGVLFLALDNALLYGTTYLAPAQVLRHLGIVNLILATFNLLPGFPLDGGRVLRAVLWWRRGDPASALRSAKAAGRTIGIALLCVGGYETLGPQAYLTGMWALTIGIVLLALLGGRRRGRTATAGELLAASGARPLTVPPTLTIARLVEDVLPLHRQASFAVAVDGRLHGMVRLADCKLVARKDWAGTPVANCMSPVDETQFVSVTAQLEDVEQVIRASRFEHIAVLDGDGMVVGTLGLDQVRQS